MNTVIMITHPGIGDALRAAALATLKSLPCDVIAINCPQDADTQKITDKVLAMIESRSNDEGLIIFSDVFGATPHNTAQTVANNVKQKTHLISGINLPMLMRTLNYIDLSLDEVCEKAIKGGAKGICDCHNPQEHPAS